jgi:hypothetical protein
VWELKAMRSITDKTVATSLPLRARDPDERTDNVGEQCRNSVLAVALLLALTHQQSKKKVPAAHEQGRCYWGMQVQVCSVHAACARCTGAPSPAKIASRARKMFGQ